MRSRYFAEHTLGDVAKKNIGVLAGLSEKTLDKLAGWFEEQKTYRQIDLADVKTLSISTGEGADTLWRATQGADILIERMGEYEDAPEDILADAVSLKILPEMSPGLLTFLKRFAVRSKAYYLLSRTYRVARSGMPNLMGTAMTVAVKPVFDKDFNYGTDDITKYTPSLVNCAVVAQFNLESDGYLQDFAFQVTKDTLDKFISDLLALQKQMVLAEEKLKIAESTE